MDRLDDCQCLLELAIEPDSGCLCNEWWGERMCVCEKLIL